MNTPWREGMRVVGALVIFFACGAPEGTSAPEIEIVLLANDPSGVQDAAAAQPDVEPPSVLLLTLSGPDGIRSESVPYEKGGLRLGELSEGRWQLRGDGLDEAGQVTWQADPVEFTVRAGKSSAVRLELRAVDDEQK